MGTPPVDTITPRAAVKLPKTGTCLRQQALDDRAGVHRDDQRVAANTACKRFHAVDEVESFEHFYQLRLGVGLPDPG